VEVLANSIQPNGYVITRQVASAAVSSGDEALSLAAGQQLHPREFVTARQRTDSDIGDPLPAELGVEVMSAPNLAILDSLFSAETLRECGTCFFVSGAVPGATVTMQRNNEPPLQASANQDYVSFHLPAGERLRPTDSVVVSQTACGLTGSFLNLPAPVASDPTQRELDAPTVIGPLVRCQTDLHLDGVIPGATVAVGLNGQVYRGCFESHYGWFRLPRRLRLWDVVSVRQEFVLCQLSGVPATATVSEEIPPSPHVVGPLCEGDRFVRVSGLYKGALVELELDGRALCRGSAPNQVTVFGIPSISGGRELTVRQSMCDGEDGTWSPWSKPSEIHPLGLPNEPEIVAPLIERGVAVGVLGVAKGTFVQLVGRRGVIGETWANGDKRVDVPLFYPLARDDLIHARTVRCGARHDWETKTRVDPIQDVTPPRVADPACDCGGSVQVRDVIPGAIVEVARLAPAGPLLVGSARAGIGNWSGQPESVGVVSVGVQPLAPGDRLQAQQRMGSTRSGAGPVATVGTTPRWAYVPDSAFRLCQLTNDWDPSGRPRPVATTPIGLTGTDLGTSVEHAGRLYLFFGDCTPAPGVETDADPIAWLTMDDPDDLETEAPDLHWILGANGKFRRLAVDGLPPLGNWCVPTGAFSYDGLLYVFVANERAGGQGEERMTASHLAGGAAGAGQNLTLLQHMSSTIGGQLVAPGPGPDGLPPIGIPYPAGRWMLHISPTVVRNVDWPGLPTNVGDGLLMFGSSIYNGYPARDLDPVERVQSNVYLAWAPLAPGVSPPQAPIPSPHDWQFLTGLSPTGQPSWGTLSSGDTPVPLLPADPTGLPADPTRPRLLGEISVVWYPELRRWILAGSHQAPINLARQPWGPWTPSDTICDPNRLDRDADNLRTSGEWIRTTLSYAPYQIRRWIRWDASQRSATLYFTLSVFDAGGPLYQPHLMRSKINCLWRAS
jgi:hypothetical protein